MSAGDGRPPAAGAAGREGRKSAATVDRRRFVPRSGAAMAAARLCTAIYNTPAEADRIAEEIRTLRG